MRFVRWPVILTLQRTFMRAVIVPSVARLDSSPTMILEQEKLFEQLLILSRVSFATKH
jgi:hypothetical protein